MKLSEALEHYGSKTKLARRLRIGRSAVTMWGEEIPILRQYEIERDTQGKLRVDRQGTEPADQSAN